MLEGRAWLHLYALPWTQGCAVGREAAATFVCVQASPSMWLRRSLLEGALQLCASSLQASEAVPRGLMLAYVVN